MKQMKRVKHVKHVKQLKQENLFSGLAKTAVNRRG